MQSTTEDAYLSHLNGWQFCRLMGEPEEARTCAKTTSDSMPSEMEPRFWSFQAGEMAGCE
jgi:hypothetical protein